MCRVFLWLLAGLLALAAPVLAQDRVKLGYGRLANNDLYGDRADRWQTASLATSRVWGQGWDGTLPERPLDLLELRIGVQLMAPENLRSPAPGDRPYAGALSLGLHSHFALRGVEVALGGDLVATGPQTRLGELQTAFHDTRPIKPPTRSVLSRQVENGLHPTLVAELARGLALGASGHLRSFVETRWGAESLVRAGADLRFGSVGQGELLVRDPVTGHRYRTIKAADSGTALILGADLARVGRSVYLPADRGHDLTGSRKRVRAGVHWQGERRSLFYGLTWLGPEFDAQRSGQTLGSLRIDLAF